MIPLRVRLSLFLVAAVVSVVVAAAFVTTQIVDGPRDGSLERRLGNDLSVMARLLDGSAERARAAGLAVGAKPAPDTVDAESTRDFAEDRTAGQQPPALILRTADGGRQMAFALNEADWVYVAHPSRPSALAALASYLSLVVLGTTAIALFVAKHILGPMRMLERALQSVQTDGTLAFVPERGSTEVKATARALNALSNRLRLAMESRMRLIAAAGHDLRTPMTRLRLRAEFLPDEERAIWLRDLEELDRIADSAIRLVREESDKTVFEEKPVGPIVAAVVTELQEMGQTASLRIIDDPAVPIQALAIKRALRNLIENATRHGGGAEVTVFETGDSAGILIVDDGPGIPEELLGRVFEPFFRVDAARRKSHPGAGLGLAIARGIVERHGGTLSIHNRRHGGLVQEMRLPKSGTA